MDELGFPADAMDEELDFDTAWSRFMNEQLPSPAPPGPDPAAPVPDGDRSRHLLNSAESYAFTRFLDMLMLEPASPGSSARKLDEELHKLGALPGAGAVPRDEPRDEPRGDPRGGPRGEAPSPLPGTPPPTAPVSTGSRSGSPDGRGSAPAFTTPAFRPTASALRATTKHSRDPTQPRRGADRALLDTDPALRGADPALPGADPALRGNRPRAPHAPVSEYSKYRPADPEAASAPPSNGRAAQYRGYSPAGPGRYGDSQGYRAFYDEYSSNTSRPQYAETYRDFPYACGQRGGSGSYAGGSGSYPDGSSDYTGGSASYSGSGNFSGSSSTYSGASNNYSGASNDYSAAPNPYAGGANPYAGGAGSFPGGPGRFAGGPTTFAGRTAGYPNAPENYAGAGNYAPGRANGYPGPANGYASQYPMYHQGYDQGYSLGYSQAYHQLYGQPPPNQPAAPPPSSHYGPRSAAARPDNGQPSTGPGAGRANGGADDRADDGGEGGGGDSGLDDPSDAAADGSAKRKRSDDAASQVSRLSHLASEKRRRTVIKTLFDQMSELVPQVKESRGAVSKSACLNSVYQYLLQLSDTNTRMRTTLINNGVNTSQIPQVVLDPATRSPQHDEHPLQEK